MSRVFFSARQLTVGYDGAPVVRDIDIDVEQGEIVALVGPNGSGKSTILKSVARQLKPLGGAVFVGGEDLEKLSAQALSRTMAVMLTERARPEWMTCRDVVAAGRYPYTGRLGILTPADEAKVEAAMADMRVLELSSRDFNAISDGQRQRLLLARALCQEPRIIVLDEPTSYLDIRHKLQLLSLLRTLARARGIAVILSLHEIDLAAKLADRVVCVKDGCVTASGRPEDVFTEAAVRALYDLEAGGYDPLFGSLELPKPPGAPQAFVLSACGTGIPVYRALQREGTPFAAGILYENDVDCRAARFLATEVVAEAPFMPISDAAFDRAMALMRACRRIIDAGVELGETNARMANLIDAARRLPGYEARAT